MDMMQEILQQVTFLNNGRNYTHRYTQYNELGRPLKEQLIANLGVCQHEYNLKGRQTLLKDPIL